MAAKKQFSACAKLTLWLLSVGAFLGTLFALIGGEGAVISKCSREYQANGLTLDTLPDACSRNKRGSTWLEGTCGGRDVSLTLYEYCERPRGSHRAGTCYDFVDHPAVFFKNRAGLSSADFVDDIDKAQTLVLSSVVFSVLLLAFGCLVLVNDDMDNGAKTTFIGLLICLAHIVCSGNALSLVHGSSIHTGGKACTNMRGIGVMGLAIAMGCSSLTLLLFFPCFCGPFAVCLDGGNDEENQQNEGKTGVWATACSCMMAVAVCFATLVGTAYQTMRAVVTKCSVIIWPLLCLPCCCITKIVGKRLHPSEKMLKLCTLLSIAVLGILTSVLFGEQKTFASGKAVHGSFGAPLVKATCADKRILFVTLGEGCEMKKSGGIDCYDYADGALPRSVFGSTANTKFHQTMGREAFILLLVAVLIQFVCIFALVSIFSYAMCRRQPQAASLLTGVGLWLSTSLTVTAVLLINDSALASSWVPSSCAVATASVQAKMGPGLLMLVLAIVVNSIAAVLTHWPIYLSIFGCLKCCQSRLCKACVDGDEEDDEDKPKDELAETSSELKTTQGTKHVV